MDISAIPGIRQRANLITGITVVCLALQAVSAVLDGVTTISAILYLLTLGLNALLLYGLYAALKPTAYSGLGILSTSSKALFIGSCVLLGVMGLVILLALILEATAEAGTKWTFLLLALIPAAQVFIRAKYYSQTSKVAKQLKTNTYRPSETPETWAILCAAGFLIYLAVLLILTFVAPALPNAAEEGSIQHTVAQMTGTLANAEGILFNNILPWIIIALQSAAYFAVYLLLRTLRANASVSSAAPHS